MIDVLVFMFTGQNTQTEFDWSLLIIYYIYGGWFIWGMALQIVASVYGFIFERIFGYSI